MSLRSSWWLSRRPTLREVPFRRCHRRRVPGQGQTGTVKPNLGLLSSLPFCLCHDEEADVPVCLHPSFPRCGIRIIVEDVCPLDQIWLHPKLGCSCWCRTLLCSHAVTFGFLFPGSYVLTLIRRKQALRLSVELPPGGNVTVRCTLRTGQYRWQQDLFHYFFNTP